MKDFIAGSERRFDERFCIQITEDGVNYKTVAFICETVADRLKVLTPSKTRPDHITPEALKSFYRTELLAAYEKGRKDFGEEMVGKALAMKRPFTEEDPNNIRDKETYGYNLACHAVAKLLRESVGEKV